jgi:hypothetical protein
VEVFSDGDTDIRVFMGAVTVESRKGETLVEDGEMLALDEYWADLSPLGRADAWERWNLDRDRFIEGRKRSVRYLPAELAGYSNDFDNNGEWVEVSSYGYVWRPIVQVSLDWSPYRHGRWVWIGDDYVWIARESWGWAPYHYGRWSHVPRYGWCWVPPSRNEVYWGPGYVGWVHTATYVAWVPLAPREVYYGRGYHGSNSIDITHVDINRVSVNIVYKNVHVNNSVTTVHKDTFIRGRQVDFKVDKNPFLSKQARVGRPEIRPERATRMPSMREIPPDKAPPAKIREARVEDFKKHRRLVTRKDKSVFEPQTEPRTMEVEQKKTPRARTPRKDRLREGDSKTVVPRKREDARPVPAERGSQLKSRQENRQRPQPGARDRESTRSEGDSRANRGARQYGVPEEEVQAAPAERGSQLKSRQENRQRPQPGARDRESTRSEGDSRANRGARQSTDSKEARTTPAATKEGTKAERPTLTPEQKKKMKKKLSPEELEKLSPEELEKLSHEEEEVPRERYRK